MKRIALEAPEWLAKNAVYQINPRTFSPEGTLEAVTRELPRLRELGFYIMYLCPIFEADPSEDRANWSTRQKKYGTENPKNPYRMNDYFRIDEEYGSMEDLRAFIAAAHALGMRVLLDLVYLHIGPNAPILQRHPEFACQDAEGVIQNTQWFFPHLDFNSPGLREYLWCNMVYYIGELDADGFRCDVGDQVPIDFWVEGRRRMQTIKPDSVLINEGRNWDTLLTGFDAIYHFAWHVCLYSVFAGEMTLDDLRRTACPEGFPQGGLLLRDIDNHDTVTDWPQRAEVLAGHDGMELIEVVNYLIDGIPMVYCGNELADTARVNMFANRFHMGVYEATDRRAVSDASLRRQALFRQLNALKRESETLRRGATRWIANGAGASLLSFAREYGDQRIILIANFAAEPVTASVDADLTGRVLLSAGFEATEKGAVTLAPRGYLVLEQNA